jgi:lysophospholipase L1-like esterase
MRTTDQAEAVMDLDRALRDPKAADRLLPVYDSEDHLHPDTDGYQAMADPIDLRIFR